jgi:hypothetical protein
MQPKYSIGQEVRCVSENQENIKKGQILTILSAGSDCGKPLYSVDRKIVV